MVVTIETYCIPIEALVRNLGHTAICAICCILSVVAGSIAVAESVKLPGIEVNVQARCVDVEATVCLREGTLELVACTKDSKEHESIVAIAARPMHVHAALLLLGAEPGNPAIMKPVEGEDTSWLKVPPRGDLVEVSLVWKKEGGELVERPISDFIVRADSDGIEGKEDKERESLPTHAFLFAGSRLIANGEGPRIYLSDRSGNLISLATFGDELLCLPGVHSRENGALLWEINATQLPELGAEVILRLRPKMRKKFPSSPEKQLRK